MSPKNTFITKLIFTFITVFISTQAQAASHEFCERYARHALEQFEVHAGRLRAGPRSAYPPSMQDVTANAKATT